MSSAIVLFTKKVQKSLILGLIIPRIALNEEMYTTGLGSVCDFCLFRYYVMNIKVVDSKLCKGLWSENQSYSATRSFLTR
jgi:hypothetical protein